MQTTIRSAISFTGVGLHSGKPARLTICPASAEYGVWFKRTDIAVGDAMVPARWDATEHTPLCTRICNRLGVSVSTIEHVMAALAGCGIHNALIEIDGPEVPILDGSAAPFVRGILARGVRELNADVRVIEILKKVEVKTDQGWARLEPGSGGLTMDFHINFADRAIGTQNKSLDMRNGTFVRELCDSRTFCRQADVDAMREKGLALGGTMDNAVVVDGDRVLSPGGLRHKDEAVRHKMLDALGDLALAGAPILGHYTGHKAGHTLTNLLLRELFNTPGAYRMTLVSQETAARLPGAGVERAEIPAVA
ncbi:UDP-3-O-(3-hydroxymyristoyl) glucosamine N-acyltransferase [Puniceibacterium antarcticum]|uniref:UDP-3-O-acyl-N-acetylglucosamine deacetylase n=1 Tax=Puniceibacterium antarcticum TaxID=1206336 RepID=A0A2G8QXV6_9RHOB|nr:UDP-3-O-acyl-N-acetylglucosamine deacetylase [Puniceibacterium antarcticum]PIL13738.1 UDP-3-O-(3-hydroxymyristoyl) glucosamine N-acyltransferase [Puniceibacterium antarcticum]